jgi:hypothetical protein
MQASYFEILNNPRIRILVNLTSLFLSFYQNASILRQLRTDSTQFREKCIGIMVRGYVRDGNGQE